MSDLVTESGLRARGTSPFRWDVITRRKWIVIVLPVISAAVAAAFTLTASPVYRAQTKIIVGQGGGLVQPGFANSIQPYTATMSDLIQSDIVARNVIRNLGLNESSKDLLKKISTSINPQTAVIDVFVDDGNANRAVAIDGEIGSVFSKLVATRFGTPSTKATGAAAAAANQPLTANVFDPAHLLPGVVSPHPARSIAIALALGLALGLIGAFVIEHFDRRLRSRQDVERAFGAPIIGLIPRIDSAPSIEREPLSRAAESFRSLRANLHYLGIQRPLQTLLVTSAGAAQGKTTVAANLAIAIARSGASVAVVDADLRRPQLARAYGLSDGAPGLTNVLVKHRPLKDVLKSVRVSPNEEATVAVLPSGPLPPNPAELMSSVQMLELVQMLKNGFDYVIFDSPPVLPVSDALELARLSDGVMVVVRRDHASSDEASDLRSALSLLDIHPLGVVLTDAETFSSYTHYDAEQYRSNGRGDRPARGREKPAGSRR